MSNPNRITREQAEVLIAQRGQLFIWTHYETQEYFFSNHTSGTPTCIDENDENWVPCSYKLPNEAEPRKGLESGVISTLDDYLLVFKDGDSELPVEDYCCTTDQDREELMDSFDDAMSRIRI